MSQCFVLRITVFGVDVLLMYVLILFRPYLMQSLSNVKELKQLYTHTS